jgi:dipeptidyl-peptidase-4
MKKIFFILLVIPTLLVAQNKQITLDDLFRKGTFRSEGIPGFNSMKDGEFYTEIDTAGNIIQKSFITGETVKTLIYKTDVKDEKGDALDISDFEFSNNEKKILIFINREFIYRRSSKAIVYSYDIASKKTTKIDNDKILHATYSPDNSKVAFVKKNNLFYKDLLSNKTIQVTRDGKWNYTINGNCDWVYEEEFSFTRAFQWSPAGNYLAYYRFDESKVPEYTFAVYDSLYPKQYTYKYPKAGERNSIIEIHVYDTKTGNNVKADIGKETDIYIPRISWTKDNNKLSIAWLNRLQNNLKLLSADAITGKTKVYYEEKNYYYVDAENADIEFLEDGKHFIMASEKSGYQHIYLESVDGKEEKQLTKGNFDVASIIGIDEKNGKIYFSAAYRSPMEKDFCVVNLDGSGFKLMDSRLGTHNVHFNADYTYYVDNFSTLTQPFNISIYDINSKLVRTLKDNAKLSNTLKEYALGIPEFIKVPTTKGDTLNGWMLKPKDFDVSKKYPVLFCNYGGPGSQQVADRWGAVSFWHQLLTQKGYIIVSVDNTGTGYRGEAFKKKTYLQLGKYEIEDQIDAAKYLGSLSFVDAARIGHWGWSFGGFMSSLAITKGAGIFKTAIAVAPVTSWRFYDNIYTERYMRTPQENAKGYDDNSPLNFTNKIKGKFLIIHGTADDNVHYQNSVMMVDKMIQNNVEFQSAYYPNKNHGIYGGNTTYHLYTKMTKFILDNL